MRYRVIYFKCLCYLSHPLCIVLLVCTWHVVFFDTLCVSLFPLFFLNFLFLPAIYANKDVYKTKGQHSAFLAETIKRLGDGRKISPIGRVPLPIKRVKDMTAAAWESCLRQNDHLLLMIVFHRGEPACKRTYRPRVARSYVVSYWTPTIFRAHLLCSRPRTRLCENCEY